MIFPFRYGIISPQVCNGWSGDQAEGCRIIMNDAGIDPSKWQAGKTKLFLKEPSTVSFLDSQQEATHGSFLSPTRKILDVKTEGKEPFKV